MSINASILYSLAIIAITALTQAGFQLGVGLLIISANSISLQKGKKRNTLKSTTGIFIGYSLASWLTIIDLSLIASNFYSHQIHPEPLLWLLICGLNIGVALAVWFFYFRKGKGTMLWLPRGVAQDLTDQTTVSLSFRSNFALGMIGFFGEALFLFAPLLLGSFLISTLPHNWNLIGILLYGLLSTIFMTAIWVAINSGQHLSYLQRWREKNKGFLQFAIGTSLIILALFVFINYVLFDKIVFG